MPGARKRSHYYGVFGGLLTLHTAQLFLAPGILAHDGVRVFHRREVSRAVVAGAGLFATLLLALVPLAFDFRGAGDQSETVRAGDGVAEKSP